MYRLINDNLPQLLNSLDRGKVIDPYLDLLQRIRTRALPLDAGFKQSYRQYWGMNAARLGTYFDRKYFALLALCKKQPEIGVGEAATQLLDFTAKSKQRSVQFSFATKLVHMVNPNTPIYDSNVRAFFFLRSVGTVKDREEKLRRLIVDHHALTAEYDRILQRDLLTGAIQTFREKFDLKASVYSDTKVIDTLIWRFVSFMRRHPLGERSVLYT